jgi:hypothetical protein
MFNIESTAARTSAQWRDTGNCGRSDIMRFEMEPSQDLGLQHMLQNGVAALRGADLSEDREDRALGGVLEIVTDADRGCEALREQSLTFARSERPAFERFSLFLSYLGDPEGDLSARLAEAKGAIQRLRQHDEVSQAQRDSAANLLESLLQALKRERALTPLPPPREIYYNSVSR